MAREIEPSCRQGKGVVQRPGAREVPRGDQQMRQMPHQNWPVVFEQSKRSESLHPPLLAGDDLETKRNPPLLKTVDCL